MPRVRRYHFHLVDGVETFDVNGAMLVNDEAARAHAEGLADEYGKVKNAPTKAIRVTNDQGSILFRVPIRHST